MRVPIGDAYGTNLKTLRRVLLEVAAERQAVMQDPPPRVLCLEFGDRSLNFELAVWTTEMAKRPQPFRKLRENKIDVPFPQRDLNLRTDRLLVETPDAGSISAQVER